MKYFPLWLVVFLATAGCDSELITVDVDGLVQKGPFVNGTNITIAELDSALNQTGNTFSTTIVDDTGTFGMDAVTLETSLARISADGFYFDEVRGELSNSRLVIFTFADVADTATVNVNLLGHLEAARIQYLVAEEGLSFADAKAQTHEEVLGIFVFSAEDVGNAEQLDIGHDGAGNAKLLAMSIILQGTRTVAELAELLSTLQTDIRTDGTMDSTSSGEALMNGAKVVNLSQIRTNLEERFDSLGLSATVADFESQVQHFIDNAPYDFTGGIDYASDGTRENVLDQNVTVYQSGHPSLGFRAVLPPTTQVTVRITRTEGVGDDNAWGYATIDGLHWTVTQWDGSGVQEFTSTHDGELDVEGFDFLGTGAATIDYFEYGSEIPTFTKDVTWAP